MLNLLLLAKLAFLDPNPTFRYSNLLPQEQAEQMRAWQDRESEAWRLYIQMNEEKSNEQVSMAR